MPHHEYCEQHCPTRQIAPPPPLPQAPVVVTISFRDADGDGEEVWVLVASTKDDVCDAVDDGCGTCETEGETACDADWVATCEREGDAACDEDGVVTCELERDAA